MLFLIYALKDVFSLIPAPIKMYVRTESEIKKKNLTWNFGVTDCY